MASAALLMLAAAQLILPAPPVLPEVPANVPRRTPAAIPPAPAGYPAIVERPLFMPDRRPADGALAATLDGFEILGIAVAGPSITALLRRPDGTVARLHAGEELDGWRLRSADRRRLVFERGAERREITLPTAPRGN